MSDHTKAPLYLKKKLVDDGLFNFFMVDESGCEHVEIFTDDEKTAQWYVDRHNAMAGVQDVVGLMKDVRDLVSLDMSFAERRISQMKIREALITPTEQKGDGIHTTKDFGCNRCGYQRCVCGE